MKTNTEKRHLIYSTDEHTSLNIESEMIRSSKYRELVGVKIDDALTLKTHINDIFERAEQKSNALSTTTVYFIL